MDAVALLEGKRDEVVKLCVRFRVSRLRLFGSALTDEWDEKTSDLDFLVEYRADSSYLPALDRLVGLQLALEDLLGKKVDVVNWSTARNRFFRESAERKAREVYAA